MDVLTNRLTRVRRALSNLNDEVIQKRFERGFYMKNYTEGRRVINDLVAWTIFLDYM